MNDWIAALDPASLALGGFVGLLSGLILAWVAYRRGTGAARVLADLEISALRDTLSEREESLHLAQSRGDELDEALDDTQRQLAVVQTRLEEQQEHYKRERLALESAEKRLSEQFERLAGQVFDQRSKQFTELSEKQLGVLLQPLTKDLESFRGKVESTHAEELKQHAALREKLKQMESLNERLHEDATNLTRALTTDVKSQGGWGEQQLEKLLELSGLKKGENYYTQHSVTGPNGERLQPDLVLLLPEGRTIVMDSKVSLTAWTRFHAAVDDGDRELELNNHVKSIRAHIDGLSNKKYASVEELNALDFVLMFIPIESAMIAALQHDPSLTEYALKRRVALLSPANFLATVRTVASVWMVHKQNNNARDIASRAGLLYDKFVGFADNLKQVGMRLDQARAAYDGAVSQLSSGAGNLVGQAEKLRALGAKHNKQLDEGMVEESAAHRLSVVKSDHEDFLEGEQGVDEDSAQDTQTNNQSGKKSSKDKG